MKKPERTYNKSIVYLLPLLFSPLDWLKEVLGVYMHCEDDIIEDSVCNRIYVVFWNDVDETILSGLANNALFIKRLQIGNFIVLTYKVHRDYISDFKKIKEGHYSLTSENYRKIVQSTYGASSKPYKVVCRHQDLVKDLANKLKVKPSLINEVSSKPVEEEETFRISNFLEIRGTENT